MKPSPYPKICIKEVITDMPAILILFVLMSESINKSNRYKAGKIKNQGDTNIERQTIAIPDKTNSDGKV